MTSRWWSSSAQKAPRHRDVPRAGGGDGSRDDAVGTCMPPLFAAPVVRRQRSHRKESLGILGMGTLGAGAAQGGVPLSRPLCGLPCDGRALNLPREGIGARAYRNRSQPSREVSFPGEGEHRGLTHAGSRSAVGARRFKSTISAEHRDNLRGPCSAVADLVRFISLLGAPP